MTTLYKCVHADRCTDPYCIHQRYHTERDDCQLNRACDYSKHVVCRVARSNIENLKPPAGKLRICPA